MRLQDEPVFIKSAPAAAVSLANINQINRPLCFAPPVASVYSLPLRVHQNQRARPQQRLHPMVRKPHVSVTVGRSIPETGCFKASPLLHHSCQVCRALRIKRRVKPNRQVNSAWGRGQMCVRRSVRPAIRKTLAERNVIPLAYFFGT